MTVSGPAAVVAALADTVSQNGNLLLNLSPRADGTIPDAQQQTLLAVGAWLAVNGESIYSTHSWITFGEGGERGRNGPDVRYTVKGDTLYAIVLGDWTGGQVTLRSLAARADLPGTITSVHVLGIPGRLEFTRAGDGLTVTLPASAVAPPRYAHVLKITGLRMNPSTRTNSGNPFPHP